MRDSIKSAMVSLDAMQMPLQSPPTATPLLKLARMLSSVGRCCDVLHPLFVHNKKGHSKEASWDAKAIWGTEESAVHALRTFAAVIFLHPPPSRRYPPKKRYHTC